MDTLTTDILICGAGAPGLALALLLAGAGARVALLDRAPLPAFTGEIDGRTSALMHGSVNILKRTGAWDRAAPYGEPMKTLRIVDETGSGDPERADFNARELGLPAFGVNMPNAVLTSALAEKARAHPDIDILAPASVEGLSAGPDAVTATVNGRRVKAKLAVGADGRDSAVRRLAGIDAARHDYGQRAITCLIGHSLPHRGVSTEFHRPSGPFTLVPLPGDRSSVVWVEFERDAESIMAMDRRAFERALQDRTRGELGEIAPAGGPASWPLQALTAARMTAPRVALVAEAAHVLHPLGAQGLNLSLRDAAALAETVVDAMRLGQDPGAPAALRRYEDRRRADFRSRAIGTRAFNRIVSTDDRILTAARRAGLRAVSGIAPLKRLAMREGLSPGLEDSRLARGEAL